MNAKLLCATALVGVSLCSCVRITPGVPDMPYNAAKYASRDVAPTPPPAPAPAAAPATPAATPATPAAPAPVAAPATPKPAPVSEPSKPLDLTQPITTPKPAPEPTPAPAPVTPPEPKAPSSGITTPANGAAPQPAAAPEAPKKITNKDGHIPTAMRVEGDPTRVYNPLDPSKTIRVIDKNGNPYPSGKELKVRGTDYHFYVP